MYEHLRITNNNTVMEPTHSANVIKFRANKFTNINNSPIKSMIQANIRSKSH